MLEINKFYNFDVLQGLKLLDDKSINCCVTSPPYYGLRDYGLPQTKFPAVKYKPMTGIPYDIEIAENTNCLGLEPTIEMFVGHIVLIFREVYRVLKDNGTLWLNFGDSFVGTGGDRKKDVSNKIFQEQQSHNPCSGRYEKNKSAKKTGLKVKDLMGIPWRIALALQADGWYLRMDNIWHKSNCMPEAVKDRPTKSHEYMFLLSKKKKYYYDFEIIKEPCVNGDPNPPRGSIGVLGNLNQGRRKGNRKTFRGGGVYTNNKSFDNSNVIDGDSKGNTPNLLQTRNKRSVWTVATSQFKKAHFATFPEKLIEPCILAGCPENGIVLDPFIGSGTVAMVSKKNKRNFIGIDYQANYLNEIALPRVGGV